MIDSNHDNHLDKWWENFSGAKTDPKKARFAGWLASQVPGTDKSALQVCFEEFEKPCSARLKWIDCNKPALIKNIDLSQHGDKGTNGSRGSAGGFAQTTWKTFLGHSHSPCIEKGSYQVGVGTKLPYAKGYSTWALCDGIIYPDGNRDLLLYIDYKFRR